jgi:hypothetical protein
VLPPAPPSSGNSASYALSPEPPQAPASPPPSRESSRRQTAPEPPPRATPAPAAPTALPSGYTRELAFALNPKKCVRWVAPIAATLLFVLLFFTWVGAYPGGHPVYTQSAFQAIWGGFTSDPVGEKVLKQEMDVQNAVGANGLMFLYLLVVVITLALAVLLLVHEHAPYRLPAVIHRYWSWRWPLLAGAALLGLVLLFSQLALGFGLETGLGVLADKAAQARLDPPRTPEELEIATIRRGLEIGRYNLRHTAWLSLSLLCQLLLLASAGLAWWFERRGSREVPRVRVVW